MRRILLIVAGAALLATAGWTLFRTPTSTAEQPARVQAEEAPKNTTLAIGQVVLFSSGVGYFQREGTVVDDARVDLSFPVSDINDLIKSMVLRDQDGGADAREDPSDPAKRDRHRADSTAVAATRASVDSRWATGRRHKWP